MPACAREPSGTLVEVLCGQPEQKYGARLTASLAFESSSGTVKSRTRWRRSSAEARSEPVGDDRDQARRPQLAELADQRLAVSRRACRRRRPHARGCRAGRAAAARRGRPFSSITSTSSRPSAKASRRVGSSGNGKADLVDADAGLGERRRAVMSSRRNTSIRSRCALPQVTMPTFARGARAIARSMRLIFANARTASSLACRRCFDRERRQVGPAVVQAVGRANEAGRQSTSAALFQAAARALVASRSTVEPLSTVSEIALKPTHAPEKRDSAQP